MPNRPRKSPQTEIDLTSIYNFIADDNPRAANVWLERIEDIFDMLAEAPYAGRERHDLAPHLRSFPVGRYLVFYTPVPDGVIVVRVMHGQQDIDADDMT
ncbi:MAG: type II toxin-antitoxin system RelE/ParE family toxin [bacterium]|nr:type II toxin-antitoxin system RelE/ParE family toxin [bacterium]